MVLPKFHNPNNEHSKPRVEDADVDKIDSLDPVGMGLHHDGPYDAAMPSENRNRATAPMAAFSHEVQSEVNVPKEKFAVFDTEDGMDYNPVYGNPLEGLGQTTFLEGAPAPKAAQEDVIEEHKEFDDAHQHHHPHHHHDHEHHDHEKHHLFLKD